MKQEVKQEIRQEMKLTSQNFHSHCLHARVGTGECRTIVYLCSVDPRKLRVGVKYYIVHMYSMPYYTYGSTANFLFLEPIALICI